MLNGSNDVDSRRDVPFGCGWYCNPFMGSNCPKTPILGAWIGIFSAKRAKYWKVHIIKTTAWIITKFCRVIETPKYSLLVVQICPQTNQRWWTAAILKNRKILISSQPIDRFWRNLVQWCIWTLQTPTADKILWIWQSKMAAVVILKIRKIATSPQRNNQFSQNLVKWCVWAICHCQPVKFYEFDNPRWRPPPSW